jgi:hypothetical protein
MCKNVSDELNQSHFVEKIIFCEVIVKNLHVFQRPRGRIRFLYPSNTKTRLSAVLYTKLWQNFPQINNKYVPCLYLQYQYLCTYECSAQPLIAL